MVRQGHTKNDFVNPPNAVIMPGPFYLNEPSLTSLQLRQANVVELKKNDEYWQNRLKALEANHKKINEVMEQETQRAVSTSYLQLNILNKNKYKFSHIFMVQEFSKKYV